MFDNNFMENDHGIPTSSQSDKIDQIGHLVPSGCLMIVMGK